MKLVMVVGNLSAVSVLRSMRLDDWRLYSLAFSSSIDTSHTFAGYHCSARVIGQLDGSDIGFGGWSSPTFGERRRSLFVVSKQSLDGLFVLRAVELKRAKARIIPAWPMRLAEPIPYHRLFMQANMGDEGQHPTSPHSHDKT
jgi:hypothetical protein